MQRYSRVAVTWSRKVFKRLCCWRKHLHYYILRPAEVVSASAFPLLTQHDTRAASVLQELKYKQHLMADAVVCSSHSGRAQEKLRSWSASRYLGVAPRGGRPHPPVQSQAALLSSLFLAGPQRCLSAVWHDTVLGPGKTKKKVRRTMWMSL